MPVGEPELVTNLEPRCPVILLLDTSGSMCGKPIEQLNTGIATFKQEIETDNMATLRVEVAIITFGSNVSMFQDFTTVDNFIISNLTANGNTPMGEAINYGLDVLEDRKQTYRNKGIQYYRPWVFLVTDGAPTDSWQNAAQRVRDGDQQKKHLFFVVGVQGADMNILSQIAPSNRPPLMLNGLDFKSMFQWISASVTQVSHSKPGGQQTTLPPMGWGQVSI
ncbi:vWA domain-containing protein [Laspinema olomoucense]|uniref:VWA domain-containing protein n=1 Tax=Laspinema olomoucense D3b TaxID=2953688 RepID=A0ABT2NA74_9CYAN|nr:VWA domain-containing protein [Laspinema sp. D3b]MCT7979598.1 VWA domain-containing protein [Laspinema sp. D3b]